jgi:hypothetical protein
VKDFSEFWLNNGGIDNLSTLPVQLVSFTARKIDNKDVVVNWVTASENNIDHFEIEVARGNPDFQNGRFVKIGELNSKGNSATGNSYQFTDTEQGKSGTRYYRLKIVEKDGSFSYSVVRPVVFDTELKWDVYPNPSSGMFNLVYQLNTNEKAEIKIVDANGKLVKQISRSGNGFVQKMEIDLRENTIPAGIYLLQVSVGDKQQVFRLIKR